MGLGVTDLRCEYLEEPLGLHITSPRLSWTLEADNTRAVTQSARRIIVADDPADIRRERGTLWDSGWVDSHQSAHVVYEGPDLVSGQRCHWAVAVRDGEGRTSPWSSPSFWEMGLLSSGDWQASWIGAPDIDVPFLRREFRLDRPVVEARLHATALGLYRFRCNGARVGQQWFTPGWTDYATRLTVQTYDVTDLLAQGANVLAATLADGWYAGYIGFQGQREHYGRHPELLAQLVVEHDDGSVVVIGTDELWRAHAGPLRSSDMLMGERHDARWTLHGWDVAGDGAEDWSAAALTAGTVARLVGPRTPGVGVLAELEPVSIEVREDTTIRIDFGQNIAGWVRLTVDGPEGQLVRLRFAETLGPHGGLHTENLRGARATDEYILDDSGRQTWEPWFTFHGFRYVEVAGWPGELTTADVTAIAIGSDLRQTGSFDCSSPMLRQLQSNIVWSQRANFLEVPTDCPQRDERLGWLGDAQVFADTACFNQDVAPFLTKWLQDVRDAQSDEGGFPNVAPRVVDTSDGMPGWGDAGVIVSWRLWQWYADERLLAEMLPACIRWVDFVAGGSTDGRWLERRSYDVGDWLALDPGTPKDLIATAYFAHSADLVARMAGIVGDENEAARIGAIAATARQAFQRWYIDADGRVAGDTQTGHALALRLDLVPEALRSRTAAHLVADIRARGGLSVGFLGVEHLLPALTETGHVEVAYDLALAETYPSWGHAIRLGATSMWERWDGLTEEGLQDPAMNSFNHYAYGAVGSWLYRTVAGINVIGARRFRLAPTPGPGLDWARGSYRSLWGEVSCGWRIEDDSLHLEVTVPANTTADLVVPVGFAALHEDGVGVADVPGVLAEPEGGHGGHPVLGSGSYRFTATRV